eukprot:GHVO01039489.1.p1 GENE.GHVO01039489.1~~GHVO01039489.1.p1  ORF type:complete len:142 (-),score=9.11 GHVO01039489.1:568-993(-)
MHPTINSRQAREPTTTILSRIARHLSNATTSPARPASPSRRPITYLLPQLQTIRRRNDHPQQVTPRHTPALNDAYEPWDRTTDYTPYAGPPPLRSWAREHRSPPTPSPTATAASLPDSNRTLTVRSRCARLILNVKSHQRP